MFTIDRFADDFNKKVNKFNSKYYCPQTQQVDAFAVDWSGEFNWLSPPVKLIGKTIRHMKACKAKGVLFTPEWRSAYFWPLLTNDGIYFSDFIKDYVRLDPYYFNNNTQDVNSVFNGFAKFKAFAFLIDFAT